MAVPQVPTTIASAIDYLYTNSVTALASQTDVEVRDGPLTDYGSGGALCIGASTLVADPSLIETAGGQVGWRTIGATRRDEDYTIHCLAANAVGGNDFKPARDKVMSIYAAFDAMYRADLTLGGLVQVSTIATDTALEYQFSPSGPVVVFRWGVAIKNVLR